MATSALISDRTREFHLQQVDGIETQSDRIEMRLFSVAPDRAGAPAEQEADAVGVDVFRVTTQRQLRLVVSRRPAIDMTIGLMVDNAWKGPGMDRPATDRLIARVREHLRRHMGGTRPADARVVDAAAAPGLGVPPDLGVPRSPLPGDGAT